MQMKKTHDAAMVLIERLYGERPRFNYYIGTSQGGREALTVAQRYPADYDGVAANVPIVNFSSLMLAPELIRIQEKPTANWVTPAKVERDSRRVHASVRRARRTRGRHHQQLHGLPRHLRREPGCAEPSSVGGKALPEQRRSRIRRTRARTRASPTARSRRSKFVYSRYKFATPLANGVEDVRHVGAEHRSVGQRAHRERPFQRPGRRGGGRAECTRISAFSA